MLRMFYPKRIADSAYVIDYKKLYEEGYRGIIFDIDNTLVEHGADADQRAINLIAQIKKIGFEVCLISNNKEERVSRFNREIKVRVIHNAQKPAKKNFIKATKLMGTSIDHTVFIGDQLFTDVFGANRVGMMTYYVKPIGPKEEIQIVLKRKLERVVLYHYRKDIKEGKIKVQ
ncbi:YqeG family HAD IIIA-type phosphatase [Mobilitalea sibirica]|uniref:YqeG family HAD IIIA-type phosphatase n=1 Tax=Mobilitalea sibirica TaxID=1462919 RepID=A0A8J7HCT4_9FIRM|nr:YqeG family HAD IIIA-type phosphatase [Mobilitalea sibirica]MBH1940189.1 YqeG family HAD IIIA-type phosphatase [Mobilitalea sibirica]